MTREQKVIRGKVGLLEAGIADGGWLARVLVPAASTNQQARVTLQLWVEPCAVATVPPWGLTT